MNKTKALISTLCPDGVEFKSLKDIAIISNGKDHKQLSDGRYPVYGSGGIMRYAETYLYEKESVLIPRKGSLKNVYYVNKPFWTVDTIFYTKINQKLIQPKFLFYFLKTQNLEELNFAGGVPSLTKTILDKISIPLPPLPIQEEIVNILDMFTLLEAELKAELKARKKQYEHYRDRLLGFEGKKVEWKTLAEIGEFTRGKRFVKTDLISEGIPCIHYGEMYTHYRIWAKEAKSFLAPELAQKLRSAKKGDVIIVAAGETIEDIGQGVAWHGEEDVVIHDACFAYSHKMYPNYVAHFLQTDIFHSQIKRHISSGKISSINAAGLGKAKIPVPPIAEQKRIADILDKFDAIVNDISTGLPAEIAARNQQYEYYRNRLLTFKKVGNE